MLNGADKEFIVFKYLYNFSLLCLPFLILILIGFSLREKIYKRSGWLRGLARAESSP